MLNEDTTDLCAESAVRLLSFLFERTPDFLIDLRADNRLFGCSHAAILDTSADEASVREASLFEVS